MEKYKEYKIRIMWSTRVTPGHIHAMMHEDRIDGCIKSNRLAVKMYDSCENELYVKLSEPHCWIKDIEISKENGYIATVLVPDMYKRTMEAFVNPVIHPIIRIYPTGSMDKLFIAYFKMFDENQLNKKMIYDGVNYPDEFIDDGSAIKQWRRYPSHPVADNEEPVIPKFIMYKGKKFPLIVRGKFNSILEKLFVKEISYNITFGHNATITGTGCMVYGAGGNLDYICIGVTDRELGRNVDMRFNLHTIEYNTKGFEIHVKEPQR